MPWPRRLLWHRNHKLVALGEQAWIRSWAKQAARGPARHPPRLGIGDDAAVLTMPADMDLVVSVDTLVAGVHFPLETTPADLGHKALAVSLSDLAAMGATPAWATVSVTCPQLTPAWCAQFQQGLLALAADYQVAVVGGDTCQGPLSISTQLMGHLPHAAAPLARHRAEVGDLIAVTGALGGAGWALAAHLNQWPDPAWEAHAARCSPEAQAHLRTRLNRPSPRVQAGLILRPYARACIDISDGLLGDLAHILARSEVGATVQLDQLPVEPLLLDLFTAETQAVKTALWQFVATAGDDYELCCSLPPAHWPAAQAALAALGLSLTVVGEIRAGSNLHLYAHDEKIAVPERLGYGHFQEAASKG